MSINPQVTSQGRPARPARRLGAVTVVMVLAAVLSNPGGAAALPAASGAVSGAIPAGARARGALRGSSAGDLGAAGWPGQGVVAGPRVAARAAILADESTGQVLF